MTPIPVCFLFFFFNDTATTEIYTLSLHDALPISLSDIDGERFVLRTSCEARRATQDIKSERGIRTNRSEEHTSELQSLTNLVCRLLLEKKKNRNHLSFFTYV